jgi:hypothetical protein
MCCEVDFSWAEFTGGFVGFSLAKFDGSAVRFDYAQFTSSDVDFVGDLDDAKFEGGEVDFSSAREWRHPPRFPWTVGLRSPYAPPAVVKLPPKGDQSQP